MKLPVAEVDRVRMVKLVWVVDLKAEMWRTVNWKTSSEYSFNQVELVSQTLANYEWIQKVA